MKNLNLKVRLRNKTFVISMLSVIVAFVYQVLGLLGIVASISQDKVINILMFIINILAGFGVLVDPTTDGFKDSDRVLNKK
ncbi:hypothetical protein HMPREF3188_00092 [Tissierellia bacterium KA00581]|nr:hypothetical protein HMPREF3188_00092 [Tissierellia bacterium KA00581]